MKKRPNGEVEVTVSPWLDWKFVYEKILCFFKKNKEFIEYEEMLSMGFTNTERILQSLELCNGDLENSINYYLT